MPTPGEQTFAGDGIPSPPSSRGTAKGTPLSTTPATIVPGDRRMPTLQTPSSTPNRGKAARAYSISESDSDAPADPTDDEYSETSSPCAARAKRRRTKSGRPRFEWQEQHRHALVLLKDHFHYGNADVTLLFNRLFESDTIRHGFPQGLPDSTVTSQMNERRKPVVPRPWLEVMQPSAADLAIRGVLRQRIEALQGVSSVNSNAVAPAQHAPQQSHGSVNQHGRVRKQPRLHEPVMAVEHHAVSQTTVIQQSGAASATAEIVTSDVTTTTKTTTATPLHVLTASGLKRVGARLINPHTIEDYCYVPVQEKEAHPPLPAILYRYHDEHTCGLNRRDGFVAGQGVLINGNFPPPPACTDPRMFLDVENHVNRNKVGSPFISTSSSLFWVVRMAERARDYPAPDRPPARHGRISIIDGAIAGAHKRAFFVPPYHAQIKKKKAFTDGAWMYGGTYEFLIWLEIPPSAVIRDHSIEDFNTIASSFPYINHTLALNTLATEKATNVTRALKQRALPLSTDLTGDLAAFLLALGFSASRTSPAVLSQLVADIVRGWCIFVAPDQIARWRDLSSYFARVMTDPEPHVSEATIVGVRHAFLCGVTSGIGELNWQYSPDAARRLERRAARVGLSLGEFSAGSVANAPVGAAAAASAVAMPRSAVVNSLTTTSRRRGVRDFVPNRTLRTGTWETSNSDRRTRSDVESRHSHVHGHDDGLSNNNNNNNNNNNTNDVGSADTSHASNLDPYLDLDRFLMQVD